VRKDVWPSFKTLKRAGCKFIMIMAFLKIDKIDGVTSFSQVTFGQTGDTHGGGGVVGPCNNKLW
jgi:hypothetical protein